MTLVGLNKNEIYNVSEVKKGYSSKNICECGRVHSAVLGVTLIDEWS